MRPSLFVECTKMSYQLKIGPRQRKAGRFIGAVRDAFLRVIAADKAFGKRITQQSIALKLGVDRSVVNRWLTGEANLTLRTVGELAWALDCDISFELRRPELELLSNTLVLKPVRIGTVAKISRTRVQKQTSIAECLP